MLLQIIQIAGRSLHPAYQDGDYVLVSSIPILFGGIRPGDVIVYRHPDRQKRVKIVERLEEQGRSLFVVGLNPESVDSRTFGAIPRAWVLGKVIARIPRKSA